MGSLADHAAGELVDDEQLLRQAAARNDPGEKCGDPVDRAGVSGADLLPGSLPGSELPLRVKGQADGGLAQKGCVDARFG